MTEEEGVPKDAVLVAPFCERHRHDLIVQKLQRRPNDTFLVYEITAMMLLFQWAAASPGSPAREQWEEHADAQRALKAHIGSLGCLACWDVAAYERAAALLQKGLRVATDVVKFKAEDPGWPRTPSDLKHHQ
jgi:hypothetical protein